MNDSIDRIPPVRTSGIIKAVSGVDRDKLRHDENIKDEVHISPDAYRKPAEQKEDISLSVETLKIIAQGNLPPDIEAALTAFAPLGDLSDAGPLCDALQAKGVEFISWPPHLSLRQALDAALAAS